MTTADIYKFYINDVLLPQTPSSITISNDNKNEVVTLANGLPFTVAKYDGPQKFEFEFEITQKAYPYTFKNALQGIRYYTDLVWQLKLDREPVALTIVRSHGQPSTCIMALLDDYSYTEDAENASDYIFKLTFTEWHPQNNQELDSAVEHHLITAGNARGWVDALDKREISEAAKKAEEEENARLDKEKEMLRKELEAEERKKKEEEEEQKKQEEEEKEKEEEGEGEENS